MNCIGVEEYFNYKSGTKHRHELIFKANSSNVKLISLTYAFVDKMPEHFIRQLDFVLKSHKLLGKPREERRTARDPKSRILPQLEKIKRSPLR